MAEEPVRQDLGGARGRRRPDLHRPAPGPRGHLGAGVRRAPPRRPRGSPPRQDAGHRRPQRAHRRHRRGEADRRRALAQAGRGAGGQLRGVRDPDLLARLRPPGHRPRDRPRAGRDPAGDDDRLRRLPYLHPRRLRRPRLRDRHLRGRARARHPVPGPAPPEDDADPLLGRARRRRHRQGPDPGHDRPARHRRHAGPRGRVRGPGDRGADDGEPADGLQHDDRGRRPRRA